MQKRRPDHETTDAQFFSSRPARQCRYAHPPLPDPVPARVPEPARDDTYFRIYTAIEKTANKTGSPPEVVARALVESGLRAAKESFPGNFVAQVEKNSHAPKWNLTSTTEQQRELLSFWNASVTDYRRERRYH